MVTEDRSIAVLPNDPGAAGQFQNRMNLMETADLSHPTDFRHTRQVHVVVLLTNRHRAELCAQASPEVQGIAGIAGRPVQFQFQSRIGDGLLIEGMLDRHTRDGCQSTRKKSGAAGPGVAPSPALVAFA
jgi:hypothetical protein